MLAKKAHSNSQYGSQMANGFSFDFFYFEITVSSPLFFGFHSAESHILLAFGVNMVMS